MRQARIVDALEEEKKKISRELEEMQKKRAFRENQTPRHGESLTLTTVPPSPRDYRLQLMSDLVVFFFCFFCLLPTRNSCFEPYKPYITSVSLTHCLFIIRPLLLSTLLDAF